MSKRQQRRSLAGRKPAAVEIAESPTSRGVTVFWMTTLLATVVGELLALTLRLAGWWAESPLLLRFSNLMVIIAAATGVVCLLLTALALRWRDTPPPRPVTQFAIGASVLAITSLVVVLLSG